jgi:hypothetical protein
MIEFKSMKFLKELQRRRNEFAGGPMVFRISVPPDMRWWYWNEFGTATFTEKDTSNPDGYEISPTDAKLLFYPRKNGDWVFSMSQWMQGIHPKHMITTITGEIGAEASRGLVKALVEGNFRQEAVRSMFLDVIMPRIRNMIRESFRENLDQYYAGGRPYNENSSHEGLGQPAWQEFDSKAEIQEIE